MTKRDPTDLVTFGDLEAWAESFQSRLMSAVDASLAKFKALMLSSRVEPQVRLTEAQVAGIRDRLNLGESVSSIARAYGRSRRSIQNIRDGLTYVDDVIDVVSAPNFTEE